MEPRGCNRSQSAANQKAAEPQKQAKSVAAGGHRLPESFHGKEGVDGSSPSEGSAKTPQIRTFSVEGVCRTSSM
jgi:hypothetical protein